MQFTRLGQLHGEQFLTEGRLDIVTRVCSAIQLRYSRSSTSVCPVSYLAGLTFSWKNYSKSKAEEKITSVRVRRPRPRGQSEEIASEGSLSFDTFIFRTFRRVRLANVKRDEERGREGFRWTNVCTVFGKNLRGWSLRICVWRPTTRQFEHSLQRIVIYCQALFRTWRGQCRGSRIRSKNREAVQRWSLGKLGGPDS